MIIANSVDDRRETSAFCHMSMIVIVSMHDLCCILLASNTAHQDSHMVITVSL